MSTVHPLHGFLHFVWEHSAFYRELYRAHGIALRDLEYLTLPQLPLLTKRMVLEHFDEIVTDPRINRAAIEQWVQDRHDPRDRLFGEFVVISTSGSSGMRASMVYDEHAWRTMSAAAAVHLYPVGVPAGRRYCTAFYIGTGRDGHTASATIAMNTAQDAFSRMVVPMTDPIERTLTRLNAFQPDRLTAYSSCLNWLAGLALDGKLRISPRDVVASADRMTPAIEARIRQAWNPRLFDVYAVSESLFVGIRQPGEPEWKVLDELQAVEVLDARDQQVGAGEIGRAVLTNWTNRTLPLIRYDLTDYVICGETEPGHHTLRGFVGRTFDGLPIRLGDGQTGEVPSYALATAIVPGVDAVQFVSHSPDQVEVQYCAQQSLDSAVEATMAGLLTTWDGSRTAVGIRRVAHLWNDAESFKLNLVRRPGDQQQGLPAHILTPGPAAMPTARMRSGGEHVPFPRGHLDLSIPALFERQVARTPDATAVADGTRRWSYDDLNRFANRVANALRAREMDAARPVALLLQHKGSMMAAMLGVLKAGGWYVPLDPANPRARNLAIVREVVPSLVVTDAEGLDGAGAHGLEDLNLIDLDRCEQEGDEGDLRLSIAPDAPACVLYTSGSTGQPKGVVLDHSAVLHRAMLYTNDYAIGAADRVALLQSYVFNASVREIYATLLCGAALRVYSIRRDGMQRLATWLVQERITVLYMVPAVWRVFLQTIKGERFDELRVVRLGGEAVLASDVTGFQRVFGPGCVLANGLASTETGTICQDFFDHQSRVVVGSASVGFPVLDKRVSLVDEHGHPVDEGAIGEVVVTSAYLGPGYYTQDIGVQAQPNAARPGARGLPAAGSPEPRVVRTGDMGYRMADGRIALVGRKDLQVKLRGQRMHLAEIEQALLSLDGVVEAAVTFHTGEDGVDFLVAHVQPAALRPPGEGALRFGLGELLPDAMIPAVILFSTELPRTVTGKINRAALQVPRRGRAAVGSRASRQVTALPDPPTEQALAETWRSVLGVEHIGPHDRFFDLGGNSLSASALLAAIETRFGRSLPFSSLLQHSTIAELSALLGSQAAPAARSASVVPLQPRGSRLPVFLLHGLGNEVWTFVELSKHLGEDQPVFGVVPAEQLPDQWASIPAMAAGYVADLEAAHPRGPFVLGGYCSGAVTAFEVARQLLARGRTIRLLVIFDYWLEERPVGALPFLINAVNWVADDLVRATFGHNIGRARSKLRLLRRRLLSVVDPPTPPDDVRDRLGMWRFPDHEVRRLQEGLEAMHVYRFDRYDGPIHVFRARTRGLLTRRHPPADLGWGSVAAGPLTVETVPGSHYSMFKPPFVGTLGERLSAVLQRTMADGVSRKGESPLTPQLS